MVAILTRNEIWGSSRTCQMGNNIAEALESLDLTILNDGSSTFHCAAHHSNTMIDLSIAHDSLALRLRWAVGEDSWGSDHLPITIESQLAPECPIGFRRTPRLHKTSTVWDKFQEVLDKNLKLLVGYDTMDTQVLYASFVAIMENAVVSASPVIGRGRGRTCKSLHGPPCLWWSEECSRVVRLRKAALLKFKHTGLHSDFIEYKKSVARARCEIRRVKRECFQSFCEELRKDTDPSFAWKTVKKFQSRLIVQRIIENMFLKRKQELKSKLKSLELIGFHCEPRRLLVNTRMSFWISRLLRKSYRMHSLTLGSSQAQA